MLSDEQLVSLFQKGDKTVFDELLVRYEPLIKYYSRNLYLIGAEYEDLMQYGFLGLFKATQSYDKEKSSFKTYASYCIKSSLITAVKKFSKESLNPLNNSDPLEILDKIELSSENPENTVIENQTYGETVKRIKDGLSPLENNVLDLYLQGLRINDIATKLSKSYKAVDNALQRIKSKITKIFKG